MNKKRTDVDFVGLPGKQIERLRRLTDVLAFSSGIVIGFSIGRWLSLWWGGLLLPVGIVAIVTVVLILVHIRRKGLP